jgi:hypothetical protein
VQLNMAIPLNCIYLFLHCHHLHFTVPSSSHPHPLPRDRVERTVGIVARVESLDVTCPMTYTVPQQGSPHLSPWAPSKKSTSLVNLTPATLESKPQRPYKVTSN